MEYHCMIMVSKSEVSIGLREKREKNKIWTR